MKRQSPQDNFESHDDADPEEGPEGIGDPNRSLSAEPRTRHAFLAEDQGLVDPDDDNLSELFASMGVEERLDELGM